MRGAGLHRLVYLRGRADALFVSAHSVEHVGDQQAVDDEARLVLCRDRELALGLRELQRRLERVLAAGHAAHHLHELHHLRGVEVVKPDEALRALRRGRLVDDGQRGGVGREHGAVLCERIDLFPHCELELEILGDGLDNEVAVGELAVVDRAVYARAHPLGVLLRGLSFLDCASELLLDPAQALLQRRLVDLAHHDLVARLCGHLGDPVPHEPRSEDPHLLDLLRH